MKPIPEQPDREHRITFEIVVDAYDDNERAMGWYYYLQNAINFPFLAKCEKIRATSPLKLGEEVKVIEMAKEEICMTEVNVIVKIQNEALAVPLAQLKCLSNDKKTLQAVEDWHCWIARGYEY